MGLKAPSYTLSYLNINKVFSSGKYATCCKQRFSVKGAIFHADFLHHYISGKGEYDWWHHLCASLPQESFPVVRITSTWACGYIYILICAEWKKPLELQAVIYPWCHNDTTQSNTLILQNSPGKNMRMWKHLVDKREGGVVLWGNEETALI